jgi:hypothetical protein
MSSRKYLRRIFIAAAISSIVVIYFSYSHQLTASDTFLYAFGGALLGKGMDSVGMIYFILPVFILCFFVTEYIQSDFVVSCVYVLTRSGSRLDWIFKKVLGLLIWIAVYYLIVFAAIFATLACRGIQLTFTLAAEVAMVMLFELLSSFMLLLPANLVAVRLGAVKAFLICVGGYLALLLAGIYTSSAISILLPFSQGLYAWHQPLWFAKAPEEAGRIITGFSPIYSIAYMTVAIIFEIITGVFLMNRMDLLSVPEGEN